MSRRTTALAAALSLLVFGAPLITGCSDFAYNSGTAKYYLKDYQGAIADYNKAIEINPQYALAFANRGDSKRRLGKEKDACIDYKKAASLGYQKAAQRLNSKGGAWCRNMR